MVRSPVRRRFAALVPLILFAAFAAVWMNGAFDRGLDLRANPQNWWAAACFVALPAAFALLWRAPGALLIALIVPAATLVPSGCEQRQLASDVFATGCPPTAADQMSVVLAGCVLAWVTVVLVAVRATTRTRMSRASATFG